ncbi:MAG TPA: ABC transporter ATP-binding protein [Phnomibacter sp.]|nr:ABC transporter ATP-binding protein [Phnomibacter sp.]
MQWLSVHELSKSLDNRCIVHPVSFELSQNRKLAIAGETGSGKSTLLKMIGGLVQPDAGSIYFEGQKVLGPWDQLIPGHKHIAYLSQHFELRNNYRVFDYLDYGSELSAEEGDELYRLCEIDHLLQRKTNSGLSGGERQRIALAKMLTKRPKLLLLDEPFSNLDALHKQIVKQVIYQLQQNLNLSIILVSHDATDLLPWADEIMVMRHGKMVQQDSPEQLYHAPADAYVAGLLGHYTELNAEFLQTYFGKYFDAVGQAPSIFRPEHWHVFNNKEDGVLVDVLQVQFMGASYLLQVQLGETSIWIRVNDKQLATQPTLYIRPNI